jgi:GNAT superfamily N-acetyltransferase
MSHSPIQDKHIRRLDPKKDLLPVAGLIQTCFGHQLDADGLTYLRQIHEAAHYGRYFRWVPGSGEMLAYPLDGYVWEEDGQIVGNLTLLPFWWNNRWMYLIVNVAVLPNYRRLGIARLLTQTGLEHIRQHLASAWLQVREDNPGAISLYNSLGFKERARRASWQSPIPYLDSIKSPTEVEISSRSNQDWVFQFDWFQAIYPPQVAWNLNFSPNRYKPGLIRSLERLLSGEEMEHWSASYLGQKIGFATWEPSRLSADPLWLSISPKYEDLAIRALLPYTSRVLARTNRPLCINYPAGHAEDTFRWSGFTHELTLIWMEAEEV